MKKEINEKLDASQIMISPESKHLTANRQFQGIPGIEVTPGGRLWAIWYSGGVEEGPKNFVVIVKSDDGGENWSEPVSVIDPPGNWRAYDPTLWVDPKGRLWAFWAQCYSREDKNIYDGEAGVWGAYSENPDSDRPVWSTPERLSDGVMMNKPIILKNGEWALPSAIWKDGLCGGNIKEELKPYCGANIVISKDNGETFEYRGGVDIPDRHFDEHMHVELNDGRLWCLVRTNYGIGQSFSDDGGKNWTPGEDSGLGGPNSRFYIRRLKSGKLLLVNHLVDPEEPGKRFKLMACLSKDEGKTWYGELMLDEREAVSYPDGTEDADGNIFIIYDHERYKHGNILFARFREEDIEAGACVSEGSFLKKLINTTGGLK